VLRWFEENRVHYGKPAVGKYLQLSNVGFISTIDTNELDKPIKLIS
jgi:hypothetical protein